MYGGGKPYFTEVLGSNGCCDTGSGNKQSASYFCLESTYWRVIGIDTGYNSVGLPLLGTIPGILNWPRVGANCKLEDNLVRWLRTTVAPKANPKATLLLSHHQYFSVYEPAYSTPAEQLKEFFNGEEIVWIWGHEHRLSIYDRHSPDGNIICYGRCLGHGGMPVEVESTGKTAPLLFQDPRGLKKVDQYPIGDGTFAGWNGHVNVTLDEALLQLSYRDLKGLEVFSETFTAISGKAVQTACANPVLKPPAQ